MVTDIAGGCIVLPADLVLGYGRGELSGTAAWSVEAHLPGCPIVVRRRPAAGSLAAQAQPRGTACPARPAGSEAALDAAATAPRAGACQYAAVGDAFAARLLAVRRAPGPGGGGRPGAAGRRQRGRSGTPSLGHSTGWAALIPFLFIAPLLPLAAVAAAFSPRLDPAFDLARAAPISGAWLLCVRSVAVIAVTLVPTVAAALLLPGRGGWRRRRCCLRWPCLRQRWQARLSFPRRRRQSVRRWPG